MDFDQKNCKTCKFFEEDRSECRYNPPMVVPMPRQEKISGQMKIGSASLYPPVVPEMWCGKHVPKLQRVQNNGEN